MSLLMMVDQCFCERANTSIVSFCDGWSMVLEEVWCTNCFFLWWLINGSGRGLTHQLFFSVMIDQWFWETCNTPIVFFSMMVDQWFWRRGLKHQLFFFLWRLINGSGRSSTPIVFFFYDGWSMVLGEVSHTNCMVLWSADLVQMCEWV